jgi:hypothetical protein
VLRLDLSHTELASIGLRFDTIGLRFDTTGPGVAATATTGPGLASTGPGLASIGPGFGSIDRQFGTTKCGFHRLSKMCPRWPIPIFPVLPLSAHRFHCVKYPKRCHFWGNKGYPFPKVEIFSQKAVYGFPSEKDQKRGRVGRQFGTTREVNRWRRLDSNQRRAALNRFTICHF